MVNFLILIEPGYQVSVAQLKPGLGAGPANQTCWPCIVLAWAAPLVSNPTDLQWPVCHVMHMFSYIRASG